MMITSFISSGKRVSASANAFLMLLTVSIAFASEVNAIANTAASPPFTVVLTISLRGPSLMVAISFSFKFSPFTERTIIFSNSSVVLKRPFALAE